MTIKIRLHEWQVLTPSDRDDLLGRSFDEHPGSREVATRLAEAGMIHVNELRSGIEVRATSYVGSVSLGDLEITILPKVDFDILVSLFRYTYQLRNIRLIETTEHSTEITTFQDLLIRQLLYEAEYLIARGIQRQYQLSERALASPRGRISIEGIAKNGGLVATTLPCHYHPRSTDIVLNQMLLGGLELAAGLTSDLSLRTDVRRMAALLELSVTSIPVNKHGLQRAYRSVDRLADAYLPALRLIELLHFGAGVSLQNSPHKSVPMPGYLFDMNIFFEALLTRFLSENLPIYQVQAQYRLRDMMRYDPAFNPLRRRAPMPRPDFAVLQGGQLVTLLDTKYRDLWERPLPREMLYQLAIYALSQGERRTATILYPTVSTGAKPQVVVINEPIMGAQTARLVLRPVNLASLEDVLWQTGPVAQRRREQLARSFVFG